MSPMSFATDSTRAVTFPIRLEALAIAESASFKLFSFFSDNKLTLKLSTALVAVYNNATSVINVAICNPAMTSRASSVA